MCATGWGRARPARSLRRPACRSGAAGALSERATAVGLAGNRLGIFGQTAALKATCTRLIIEYGSHDAPADLAIIDSPGFYTQAGRATARAVAEFLGVAVPGTS